MIRLRDTLGKVIESPENLGFIEVCDLDGNVACAIYPDSQKFTHIVVHNSKEAARYASIFKVKFSKILELPKEILD
jgi:hypothetical protein